MEVHYSRIDFYNSLKSKYREYMRPVIASVVMIQSEEDVWLETVTVEVVEGGLEKQTVDRTNLNFISEDGDNGGLVDFFEPQEPIEGNVKKFIDEFSPYSIINTTDLFHDEASDKISSRYNTFGIDR